MLQKVNAGLKSGMAKMKWFFSIIAERIKVEIAVVRLLGRSEKFEAERQKLLVSIGERVSELKERKEANVLEDDIIRDVLKKLEALEEEIAQLRKEAEKISAPEV